MKTPILSALSIVLLLGFLTGCQMQKIQIPSAETATLAERADFAWEHEEYKHSERLYHELLRQGGLSPAREKQAWERLTLSAIHTGHARDAMEYLELWSKRFPNDQNAWPWNNALARAYVELNKTNQAKEHLARILLKESLPWDIRFNAGKLLAELHWERKELLDALRVYSELYTQCPDLNCRVDLEKDLSDRVKDTHWALLDTLTQESEEEARWSFPELIIRWHKALNLLEEDSSTWAMVWQTLHNLAQNGKWANSKKAKAQLAKLEEKYGQPKQGLALLLPLSGPYSGLGWKVLSGARIAQEELQKLGMSLEIKAINSESEDWLERVTDAGAEFTIVGGPLRHDILQKAVEKNIHKSKVFFTFLPSLMDIKEGYEAWRFFSSPKDQVKALLAMTSGKLGIDSYAIFYPDERYGRAMSKIFWQQVMEVNGKVNALKSYPPDDSRSWGPLIQDLLVKPDPSGKKTVPSDDNFEPNPDFKAIFIPDTMANAHLMVPEFFFYDEGRLLFLGTELWTQSWDEEAETEHQYFKLALMPGAWWKDNPAPAAENLRIALFEENEEPDFWLALGYDYIRFMGGFGQLNYDWSPKLVNKRLEQQQFGDWSLAPIHWNIGGIASQDIFLLTPGRDGLEPAKADKISRIMAIAKRRHWERIKSQRQKRKK